MSDQHSTHAPDNGPPSGKVFDTIYKPELLRASLMAQVEDRRMWESIARDAVVLLKDIATKYSDLFHSLEVLQINEIEMRVDQADAWKKLRTEE